jgi:hypothetical protein
VYFRPDVMGNDPLAIGRGQLLSGINQTFGQAVDPQAAIRVEHDLDDARMLQPLGNRRAERGAQHPRTA